MHSPFSLKNKNIVITGASSGIGRQCAISCSLMGANVVLIARNEQRLKETYQKLAPGNHLFFGQDITEYGKLKDIVNEAVSKVGQLAGFVHSAGFEITLPARSMNSKKYGQLFATNVISGFEFAKIISGKKFINSQRASFVFISSIAGIIGRKGLIGYSSSKGALIAGVRSLALELATKSISVNCISPGTVMTDLMKNYLNKLDDEQREKRLQNFPLGIGDPEDVANACVFLLSDAAKWITGTNLIVDGGYCAQ
jgi:NAD(P)-dependent dehydrogenase (short-subunit alcohol dehydrogenase family)